MQLVKSFGVKKMLWINLWLPLLMPPCAVLCPTAGWGSSSISEPGVELLHLQQVSGAALSSNVAVRLSLLLEAVLFHPAPINCWLCCSFLSPAQYQMGMLLMQVHKRPKGTLPFWARAADNISFWMMPALDSFNSFEVFAFSLTISSQTSNRQSHCGLGETNPACCLIITTRTDITESTYSELVQWCSYKRTGGVASLKEKIYS